VRTPSRTILLDRLRENGVPVALYYARPLHRQNAYLRYPIAGGRLPATDRLSETVLSLPMHPYLTADSQQRIADALKTGGPTALRGAAD
jgi:dTDP-4-amino-4,6-dideoxygalactose transaminase